MLFTLQNEIDLRRYSCKNIRWLLESTFCLDMWNFFTPYSANTYSKWYFLKMFYTFIMCNLYLLVKKSTFYIWFVNIHLVLAWVISVKINLMQLSTFSVYNEIFQFWIVLLLHTMHNLFCILKSCLRNSMLTFDIFF